MLELSSQQLASINKIQFRFCDPQLGTKYNVDTLASVLFDIVEPKGSTKVDADSASIVSIPQDVMYRMRKTLLSVMSFECTDVVERHYLGKWCDSFVFMSARGKAIRHSTHVQEAFAEAVYARESALTIIIDSSTCVKIPRSSEAVVASPVLPVAPKATTPLRRSSRNHKGRPPLAPKNVNSSIKKFNNDKSPLKFSDVLKRILPLSLASDAEDCDDCLLNISSLSATSMEIDDPDELEMTDVEPIPLSVSHNTNVNGSFNMEGLLEDCGVVIGGDVLVLAEPTEDISPFLPSSDMEDDFLLSTNSSFLKDDESDEPVSPERKVDLIEDACDTHCHLLPSFFDSVSLSAVNGSCCLDDASSLLNPEERHTLDIVTSMAMSLDPSIFGVSVVL